MEMNSQIVSALWEYFRNAELQGIPFCPEVPPCRKYDWIVMAPGSQRQRMKNAADSKAGMALPLSGLHSSWDPDCNSTESMSMRIVQTKSLTLLSIQLAIPFEASLSVLSWCAPEIM